MVMVVALVCGALISVPLLALLGARLTSNQFVRETEQSLINQAAIYAKLFAASFEELDGPLIGTPLSEERAAHWNANLHPARARLNVRSIRVLPPRPDGAPVDEPVEPRYASIRPQLIQVARDARKTTLAGVVFLDADGRDASGEGPVSFASLPEVQAALNGEIGAVLRARGDDYDPHPFSSLSRDTGYRIFLTYPVISQDRVVGVIYLSRTPLNLGKFLFQERFALVTMLISTLVGAALIGFLLFRLISRPIYALRDHSHAVALGQAPSSMSQAHYGIRELAELGESVSTMANALSQRSREISTYTDHVTHELKSPVTAIIGAAELLEDDAVDPVNRDKLLKNINAEARRMNLLLGRLREMTRVRSAPHDGPGMLTNMLPEIEGLAVRVTKGSDETVPLSEQHGQMILDHMAQNARGHGADQMQVSFEGGVLKVLDNGDGIPEGNIERVSEPFFTTRRDDGGTGMGLAIVSAILESYGTSLVCVPNDGGALFEIRFAHP
ncbi:ATP-binding protein [Litoreibacter roseus]|uniref:histidine kinase n=1 Tax=Litoreibacter roseus TaxID=2601869 RepID=A0A6N6JHH9_9RHOB|nr:ATP-binding protein [Litoreibacter roseus]GFE64672.1 two-component sensor histidine kinase [Litoreibacter roseus]